MFTFGRCTLVHGRDYLLEWTVAEECDGYYRIAIDAAKVGRPVYCIAGERQQAMIQIPDGARVISVCPQGEFADNGVRVQDQIDAFFEDGLHFTERVQLNIVSIPKFIYKGSTQLSALDIGGLQRFVNVAPVNGRRTWGKLDVELVTAAGVRTLTLYVNGQAMYRGTRTVAAGNGTIDLYGGGFLAKTGSVTLTYTTDIALADGVQAIAKWPAKHRAYLKDAEPFIHGDFYNSALQSEDLTASPWAASNTTVTADQADAPDGTHTADRVACGAGALGNVYLINNNNSGLAAGTYTASIYVKGTVGQQVYLYVYASGYSPANVQLITFDGTWQRISQSGAIGAGGEFDFVLGTNPHNQTGGSETPLAAVTFSAWGGQINAGSAALPYAKTTSAEARIARVPDGEILDNGFSNTYVFKSFVQSSGGHYALVHQVGDDGNESAGLHSGGVLVQTYALPEPPTGLAYSSGDADATIIEWVASLTAGATTNIYDSLDTGVLNMTTVSATHIAGTGTLNQTLADIGAYTGFRYILARSLKSGIEEANLNLLVLEYDAGAYVALRPPAPSSGNHFATSGRTLSVPVSIYLDPRKSAPTSVELYVYLSTAAPDYDNPTATAAVPSNPAGLSVLILTIEGTVGADGVYLFELRCKSGGEEALLNSSEEEFKNAAEETFVVVTGAAVASDNTNVYGPVELTAVEMDDPVFAAG